MTMRNVGTPGNLRRRFVLGLLALALVLLPDAFFNIITPVPWELSVVRLLGLLGISLAAAQPGVANSDLRTRRRLRWWTIPGLAATAVYLLSTDPVYLLAGFCLLTGAAVDVWMTKAHIASETIRGRLLARERFDR